MVTVTTSFYSFVNHSFAVTNRGSDDVGEEGVAALCQRSPGPQVQSCQVE